MATSVQGSTYPRVILVPREDYKKPFPEINADCPLVGENGSILCIGNNPASSWIAGYGFLTVGQSREELDGYVEFASGIVHDVRSPFRNAGGYINLLNRRTTLIEIPGVFENLKNKIDNLNTLMEGYTKLIKQDFSKNRDLHWIEGIEEELKKSVRELVGFITTNQNEITAFLDDSKVVAALNKELAELIKDDVLNPRTFRHLIAWVDCLDVSRGASYKGSQETVDINDSIRDYFSSSKVTLELSDSIPSVFADKMFLKRVWQNLKTNAEKYGKGEEQKDFRITVSTRKVSSESGGMIEISFSDNGKGIDKAAFPDVYKILELGETTGKATGGTGTGLYTVNKTIEALDGNLEINTRPNFNGTQFIIRIPAYSTSS